MTFTQVHMLVVSEDLQPAQRMYQAEGWRQKLDQKNLGLFHFLNGSWVLWKTLSLTSILHLNDGEFCCLLLFIYTVCLEYKLFKARMVFREAQWDLDPGKVHRCFNNTDSPESPQFPQMSVVNIIYWFFSLLVSFPFLVSFFLWSFWWIKKI